MTPTPKTKKVYTVSEFSKDLGVPQSSVRRWLKSGELRGTKMGKKLSTIEKQKIRVTGTLGRVVKKRRVISVKSYEQFLPGVNS